MKTELLAKRIVSNVVVENQQSHQNEQVDVDYESTVSAAEVKSDEQAPVSAERSTARHLSSENSDVLED